MVGFEVTPEEFLQIHQQFLLVRLSNAAIFFLAFTAEA